MRIFGFDGVAACLAAVVITVAGCSGGPSAPTVPASGVVTYKGAPLAGATVAFTASDGAGKNAGGVTDDQGKFQLSTYLGGAHHANGALPGEYTVSITKTEFVAGPDAEAVGTEQPTQDALNGPVEPKSLIPKKYADSKASGLTASVKPSGDNSFTFELTD